VSGDTNRIDHGADSTLNRSALWLLGSGIALVGLLLLVLWYFDAHKSLLHVLEWVDRQGAWSAVLFILIMALVVILLLPGVFFTTGAGLVFGIYHGTVYVVAGTTLGAAIAFLIARFLFGNRARQALMSNRKIRAITVEAAKSDFQLVLLTRLIPFFPFKLSNYVFGLSEFSFHRFVTATFIGCIPFSLHNVYLGSMAADLASLGAGELDRSPLQWGIYGAGFVATVVAVLYCSRLAQRALATERN
jgi:uncharacterized membrane protein YdjX (TVP38/TMEM64 family)